MDERSRDAVVDGLPSKAQSIRRRLLLRDGLNFLTLTLVALAMGGVTTVLFRTFESHREELAVRWAERGREAMANGRSAEAVTALRTSLNYRPDARGNQLALARALAASGRGDEAETYFLNLWQAQPGDGGINVELARLKRRQGRPLDAIQYYRAAIFGTWAGDAPRRRRDIRLELSSYLISLGQAKAAQAELLIAFGNNPDAASQLSIGEALESAGDPRDAAAAFRNVAADRKLAETGEAKLGELCYTAGDYACAATELTKSLRRKVWTPEQRERIGTMQQNAERLQALSLSHDLPPSVRADHLLEGARIAQARWNDCATQQPDKAADLAEQRALWKQLDTPKNRAALRHDEDMQDSFRQQIYASEKNAASVCGPPVGDDALLNYLADHPATHLGAQS